MNVTPVQEIFRWRFRKKGTQVLNMCSHFFVFSGSLLALMAGSSSISLANPSGGVVVGGSATIVSTPQELQIQQHSDRALIEWNNFDIDAGETTRFVQPGITSVALNRVVNSNQISRINGNLFANGRVIIVNPNGVLIGPNGNVDVAGFVATSADISNTDFMNGSNILTFNRAGRDDATVENNGRITVAETGIAALVAPTARNNGVINARLAKVHMAGADTFAVDFYGDGLINFSVGAKAGAAKRTLSSENNGTIIADGGVVSMTAADASEVVDSVINNKGTIQAQGLVSRNGEIILTGKGSTVKVSGKVDASATASGKAGSIKIGGDKQGQGSLARAANVAVEKEAVLMADAGDMGNGGTIILWGDQNAFSRGQFYARGGKQGGNGGFVETSSPLFLDVDGTTVNTLAPFGNAGDWLLDPTNITISTTGSSYVGLPVFGNSTVNVSTINNALSNVLLLATNDINFNTNINMINAGVGFSAFTTFGDINLNNANIVTRKGFVSLDAGDDLNIGSGRIDTNGSTITLKAVDTISLNNTTLQSDGGDVLLDGYDINLQGVKASTNGGDFTLTADQFFSDLFMDNTTINTTGGNTGGVIQVKQFLDGNVTTSELGTGNTYSTSPGGKGGKIDIYATVAKNTNNNNCLKAGGASSACTAVADPITLTVTSGGSKIYGDADPALLYTTSLNLTGDNAFYGAATRAAGENAGNYAVSRGTLDIMGSTAYNVVYNFTNPFVINKATLNILANAVSKIYGDADPALTYTANGFKRSDNTSIITGALVRASGENAGTYAINKGTLSAGNNYSVNYTGANFTITQKTLNILADAVSKVYGSADPALTYTSNGLVAGDSITGSLARDAGNNVGLYDITQGSLSAGNNYTVNFTGNQLEITPATLTVTANANQGKVYGDRDPDSLTFSTSQLFYDDTVESVLSGKLDRVDGDNAGTYAINQGTLDLLGNNYTLTYVGDNFKITPATLRILANARNKVYGDLDPRLTFRARGFKYDDNRRSVLSGSLARVAGENVGRYDITQGTLDAGSNYTISFEGSRLRITPATLTVTANAETKTYGDRDPRLTYTAEGFKFEDSESLIKGRLTRDAGENVGLYDITRGNLRAGDNYVISYQGNQLEITPAMLTILADAKAKTYGATDPTLTYTASGFKFEDSESIITGALNRRAGENVGTYAINQGNVSAGDNYTINYAGDDLTITPKSLTVRADDKTKIYGSVDPELTYTFDGLVEGDSEDAFDFDLTRSLGENVGRYKIFFERRLSEQLQPFAEGPVLESPIFDIAQNYEINLEGGTFTITPKSLILRADNKSKIVGSIDPALTYSFDGVVNGDENGDWSDIAISRAPGESVGNYDINLQFVKVNFDDRNPDLATQDFERPFPRFSELASQNYDITFEDGIFSITPVPTSTTSFGLLPVTSFGGLGRPIISLADRVFNQNTSFLPFILSGLNTDVGLLASGGNVPTGGNNTSAANLANIAPDAGDEDPSSVANIEPAAGDEDGNNQQGNTEQQNQSNGSDINCANSFLDNKPCQNTNI